LGTAGELSQVIRELSRVNRKLLQLWGYPKNCVIALWFDNPVHHGDHHIASWEIVTCPASFQIFCTAQWFTGTIKNHIFHATKKKFQETYKKFSPAHEFFKTV